MQQQSDHLTPEGVLIRLDTNDKQQIGQKKHHQQVHRDGIERVVLPHATAPQSHQNYGQDLSKDRKARA